MNIYQAIHPILLKRTPFVFIDKGHFEIYDDVKSKEPFATLECNGKKIFICIIDFLDWKSVHILMHLGKYLLDDENIHTVIVECDCDMNEDFIYDYRFSKRPWYSSFGYIPYFRKWYYSKTKDYYQLPFLKPEEFLDLTYARDFICPCQIILEKKNIPLLLTAQKDPNDLYLRILPSSCFYKKSKRPITSMNTLRMKKYNVLDLSKVPLRILKSGLPFQLDDGQHYIPVVRYSNGMRNGCYFDIDTSHHYLGTFYYWEPESTCYLRMGKKFDYFESKFDCAIKMMNRLESENLKDTKLFEKLIKFTKKILNDVSHALKNLEEFITFEKNVKRNHNDEDDIQMILYEDLGNLFMGTQPKYLPITLEYKSCLSGDYMKSLFYAVEDELDQILAQVLINFGYEVVVLGRMSGMFRVVSEVMDVRSRQISFDNLCWKVD
jgi:hypothetical protein